MGSRRLPPAAETAASFPSHPCLAHLEPLSHTHHLQHQLSLTLPPTTPGGHREPALRPSAREKHGTKPFNPGLRDSRAPPQTARRAPGSGPAHPLAKQVLFSGHHPGLLPTVSACYLLFLSPHKHRYKVGAGAPAATVRPSGPHCHL